MRRTFVDAFGDRVGARDNLKTLRLACRQRGVSLRVRRNRCRRVAVVLTVVIVILLDQHKCRAVRRHGEPVLGSPVILSCGIGRFQ